MYPFPATASIQTNHAYDAALVVLTNHRIDCLAKGACFTIPFTAIQTATKIAGGAVRPLLRSKAICAKMHEQDFKAEWLEIMGICALSAGNKSTVILAFGASSPTVINHLISLKNRDTPSILKGESEKIRLVQKTSALVSEFELKYANGRITKHVSPDRVLTLLNTTLTKLQGSATMKPKSTDLNVVQENDSSLLLVCVESSYNDVVKLMSSENVTIASVESLSEFMGTQLINWRAVLGSGWLTSIDCFVQSLERTIKIKHHGSALADLSSSMRGGPAQLSVSAASKLVAFGWLPQQYSFSAVISKKNKIGKFAKTKSGAMTDGDISVFSLPRIIFPGEEELRISTPVERLESAWMKFQTSYAQDEIFLFFDHSAYGKRKNDTTRVNESDAVSRQLMPLGFLHPSALGILRCIFPALKIDIIGYTAAASTTTRSAELERLLRLVSMMPTDPYSLGDLKSEIAKLREPSELGSPKRSSHSHCLELDGLINSVKGKKHKQGVPGESAFPVSWPLKLIETLLNAGRNRHSSSIDLFSIGTRLISILFRVNFQKLSSLLLDKSRDPIKELELIRAIYSIITSAAVGDPDVKRSKGNVFNLLALRKEIVFTMREATKGRLAASPLIAEWMTKHVRLTCVMPLDSLEQRVSPHPIVTENKWLPCSHHSHQIYNHFFSPNPSITSIEVNVSPLLDLVIHALDTGDSTKPCGWLANKISQTNELNAAMMVRTGHLEDFPYGELLSQKKAKTPRNILATLPSQILVRCILMEDTGRETLIRWCENLCKEVSIQWTMDIGNPGADSCGLSTNTRTLFEVFGDVEGIVTAALDCCRQPLQSGCDPKSCDTPFVAYFLPDELANHLRAPNLTKSLGVRTYNEQRHANQG